MVERLGEMRKGTRERIDCFFKYSGYDKLELKHQNFFFFQAYRMHYSKKDMSWCVFHKLFKTAPFFNACNRLSYNILKLCG